MQQTAPCGGMSNVARQCIADADAELSRVLTAPGEGPCAVFRGLQGLADG